MFVDLHCHTKKSYDGFTTYSELLFACKAKNISAIGVTEHDVLDQYIDNYFKKSDLNIIKGCEFTTNLGAHIIGLFIDEAKPKDDRLMSIIDYIISLNGLILVPHPYKDNTGLLKIYSDYSFLEKCNLIEIVNGGTNETEEEKINLMSLSNRYDLRIVSGSDSHKVNQVGYYVNKYIKNGDCLYDIIKNQNPVIYYDANFKSAPRELYNFQKSQIYQALIKFSSVKIRRWIKLIFNMIFKYRLQIRTPKYKKLDIL